MQEFPELGKKILGSYPRFECWVFLFGLGFCFFLPFGSMKIDHDNFLIMPRGLVQCEAFWGMWRVLHNLRFNFFLWRKKVLGEKIKFRKPAEISLVWVRASRVERARSPEPCESELLPAPAPSAASQPAESCASSLPAGELAQWSGCLWWEALWLTHSGCLGGNVLDAFSSSAWQFFYSIKKKRLVCVTVCLFYFKLWTYIFLTTQLTSFLAV